MNKERRKEIEKITDELNDIKERLELLMGEEENAIENLPDSLKESGKGEVIQECADNLQSAADSTQEAIDLLEQCVQAG